MGDMGEVFKGMREEKKSRHADWKKANTKALVESGIAFNSTNGGECLIFREQGKPRVDFYPSTGRWRHGTMCHSGGAFKFIGWYKSWKEGEQNGINRR